MSTSDRLKINSKGIFPTEVLASNKVMLLKKELKERFSKSHFGKNSLNPWWKIGITKRGS